MIFAALLFATVVATPQATAVANIPSPEQRAAAHRMLQSLGAEDHRSALLDGVVEHLLWLSSPVCAGATGTRVRNCAAGTPSGKIMLNVTGSARAKLLAQIADIQELAYAKRLTIAEMDAVTAFASTPTGRRFFAEAPDMSDEIMRKINVLVLERFEQALAVGQPKADTAIDPAR